MHLTILLGNNNLLCSTFKDDSTSMELERTLFENRVQSFISDVLNKLPKHFNTVLALEKYPMIYNQLMNTILVQEMNRYNKLLTIIKLTLTNTQRAIKGKYLHYYYSYL